MEKFHKEKIYSLVVKHLQIKDPMYLHRSKLKLHYFLRKFDEYWEDS